jgi:phospholipid/cholesterol/gamma-HCH transport system ATP-binding protein
MELALEEALVRYEGSAVPALGPCSAIVPPGSAVGVFGGPASGKTTLLKTLAALRRPASGRILWDGEDPFRLPTAERRRRQANLGMIFQTDALFDSSTVLENVLLPLLRRRVPKEEAMRRARAALEEVGLEAAEDARPDQLSGGMRKRAGLARALVARPSVLLADDPIAGLDPATGARVCALLRQVAEGRTLVVAAPDPIPWLPFSRWLVLDGGRLLHDGPPAPGLLEREPERA